MSELRLRDCPFCGGRAELTSGMGEHWVLCRTCKGSGPTASKIESAANQWNGAEAKRKMWMAVGAGLLTETESERG